jgi:quercetin dioxygenase-like cupin family protein
VSLTVAGETYTHGEGDVLSFRGDQRHAYHNPGTATAIAYSAIAFAPTTT